MFKQNQFSTIGLKTVLILFGLYGIFLGIDFGFGGFETLGWQASTDFIEVIDESRYQVQDSNFRFFGGMLALTGLLMIYAVTDLNKYKQALNLAFGLIIVGGLARFTSGNINLLLQEDIVIALIAELLLTAILYFWLVRETQSKQTT